MMQKTNLLSSVLSTLPLLQTVIMVRQKENAFSLLLNKSLLLNETKKITDKKNLINESRIPISFLGCTLTVFLLISIVLLTSVTSTLTVLLLTILPLSPCLVLVTIFILPIFPTLSTLLLLSNLFCLPALDLTFLAPIWHIRSGIPKESIISIDSSAILTAGSNLEKSQHIDLSTNSVLTLDFLFV